MPNTKTKSNKNINVNDTEAAIAVTLADDVLDNASAIQGVAEELSWS
jgi:hypothetical protein